jgi:hypothetical protein
MIGSVPSSPWGRWAPRFLPLHYIWADQSYPGALGQWSREQLGIDVEVVLSLVATAQTLCAGGAGGGGLPSRASMSFPAAPVVERLIAWLWRLRRHRCDYERQPATSEALVYPAGIRLLLARLTRT